MIQPTFQVACRPLGLLEDDAHWDRTLEEATITDSPKNIRELFAKMLVFCQIGDPLKLWEKYRDNLAEDFIRQMEKEHGESIRIVLDIIYNLCLVDLEDTVIKLAGKVYKHLVYHHRRETKPLLKRTDNI